MVGGGGWVHFALWRVGEVGGAILIRGSVTLPCKMSGGWFTEHLPHLTFVNFI